DDHEDTCAALEKLLVRRGYLVAAAHNVRSAMEAAAHNKFDLLISDIALPDGTGIDLIMQLRAISKTPAIAISGFGNNGDIERSCKQGSPNISSNRSGSTSSKLPSSAQSQTSDQSIFINTALQRGDSEYCRHSNRFSAFLSLETAKAVGDV